jgi:D-beta-D-heptose 7-phosphate kinase/D-beta-D-heptose 1-phosphate adenosyltransferase
VVFTNGCFDLLHVGHTRYLNAAGALGDRLVVGLNSDASVSRLKGPSRPVTPQAERAEILAALYAVDAVTVFEEDTPLNLIESVTPDVLVKGGDWTLETIIGREHVLAAGGRVLTLPIVPGRSTSALVSSLNKPAP